MGNFLMIAGGVVVIVGFWLIVGKRHIGLLEGVLRDKWLLLDESLRKRQDLVPNLVETMRKFDFNTQELDELISLRYNAAVEKGNGVQKIMVENSFGEKLKNVFKTAEDNEKLNLDTNFLELKKDFKDVGILMETRNRTYNEAVRTFNKQISSIILAPVSAIFGVKNKNIFEVE